jgi:hypothetical protein
LAVNFTPARKGGEALSIPFWNLQVFVASRTRIADLAVSEEFCSISDERR